MPRRVRTAERLPRPVRALLGRAHALVLDGRAAEAIDLLTEANRRDRHPAVEAQLVVTRHEAFGQLVVVPGRTEWPPVADDPFPGDEGVPVIPAGELTGAALSGSLLHHGCLRVDGLATADEVDRLIERTDAAFADRERGGDSFVPFAPGRERAESFDREAYVRTVDAPAALFDLAELFARTRVLASVTEHLGERPAMIANKWVLRRSPSGKIGMDFHQDGAFLGEGIRTVDCWIALSDCGPGTGRPAIDLVPRRFPLLNPGEGAAFPWSLHPDAVRAAMPAAPVASPTFRAGDALFFDELLPHRTSVGLHLGARYAVESWFVAPSSYPARHVPVLL